MHLSHLASIGVRQRDVHRETAGNVRQKKSRDRSRPFPSLFLA
jgi:hypothetical protein